MKNKKQRVLVQKSKSILREIEELKEKLLLLKAILKQNGESRA